MIEYSLARFRNADADLKEVVRGSIVAFGVKVLAAGSAFAMNVVITRQLGAEEAGLYFLAYAVVYVAAAVSRLGLDNTFVRFIAADHIVGEWGRIKGLYRLGIRWSLLISLGTAMLLWLLADYLAVEVFGKPAFAEVMRIIALSIPFTALFTLHANALQGIKRIAQYAVVFGVVAPLVLLILALLVQPQNAVTASALYVFASATALALGVYWWFQLSAAHASAAVIDRKLVLSSCLPLLSVVILIQTVTWSSQIMLGVWESSADVAVFNATQRTALLASFVLTAVNSIVAPKFAAMYRQEQHDVLRRTAINATRLMVLFALAPLILMLTFPHMILLLFGAEFSSGVPALRILAFGQFINVATGSVGFLLSMTGHERLLRNNVLLAAITALALGFALIPVFGVTGAAIATASGSIVQNLLGVWQVRRVHGFNTLVIWR